MTYRPVDLLNPFKKESKAMSQKAGLPNQNLVLNCFACDLFNITIFNKKEKSPRDSLSLPPKHSPHLLHERL